MIVDFTHSTTLKIFHMIHHSKGWLLHNKCPPDASDLMLLYVAPQPFNKLFLPTANITLHSPIDVDVSIIKIIPRQTKRPVPAASNNRPPRQGMGCRRRRGDRDIIIIIICN